MKDSIERLEELREKIDRAKENKAHAEGSLKVLMKNLEVKYKIKSLDEAKSKVKEMRAVIDADDKKLEKLLGKLEKICQDM